MDNREDILNSNYNDSDIVNIYNDINNLATIKLSAKKMYDEIDLELNKIANEYLKEWQQKQQEIIDMTGRFMTKIHNLKGFNINKEVLNCENINIETVSSILNVENKYVSELVSILNTIARHGNIYQNTINQVIPHIAKQIELKTQENGIINYLYSNLYDKLSNEEITKLIEEIKNNN